MEKLLIKVNDLLIDTSRIEKEVAKKSVQFFLGRMLTPEEEKEIVSSPTVAEVMKFLSGHNYYVREAAVIKKFKEYYSGWDGMLKKESVVLVDKKKLASLHEKYKVFLLSVMDEDAGTCVEEQFNSSVLCSSSVTEGLEKAKSQLKGFTFVGNSSEDLSASEEIGVSFIGYNFDSEKTIKKIEELLL